MKTHVPVLFLCFIFSFASCNKIQDDIPDTSLTLNNKFSETIDVPADKDTTVVGYYQINLNHKGELTGLLDIIQSIDLKKLELGMEKLSGQNGSNCHVLNSAHFIYHNKQIGNLLLPEILLKEIVQEPQALVDNGELNPFLLDAAKNQEMLTFKYILQFKNSGSAYKIKVDFDMHTEAILGAKTP